MDDFVESVGLALFAHRLRRLSEQLVEATGAWLPELGVTAPPKSVSSMMLLAREGPLGVTEIAQRLRLTHPLIVKLSRELEALGLVRIENDPTDGRRRNLVLTAAGRTQADRIGEVTTRIAQVYRRLFDEAGADGLLAVERIEWALNQRSFARRLREVAPQPA